MIRAIVPVLAAVSMLFSSPIGAAGEQPEAPAVRYTLRFPEPHTHYIDVEAEVPVADRPNAELFMAVWTPGSYLVREFARHVDELLAEGPGGPLSVQKVAKNRWRVETGGASQVVVRYRVYAREMTVRTNYVDSEFALVNGAATFITLADDQRRPHEVHVELPGDWTSSMSGLESPAPNRYRAPDFDTLVDSPIVAGSLHVYDFEVRGIPHHLVHVGDASAWDGPRAVADVQQIVEAQAAFWGGLPYEKYVIFNLLVEAGGGLEHRNSTVLMASRWKSSTRRGYADWLGLVSHELFHAWNVKRLRPEALGPFDYESENYTSLLWVVEGFTSYYGDLLALRAGVITAEEYLRELGGQIRDLQSTPGRLIQPVEEASLDAWIRQYRRNENSANSTVSYYTKGAVIAFLLDVEIRRATGGARSLDDVMRTAYDRHAGSTGFTSDEFRTVVSEVAGRDLGPWLHRALDTTEELDYDNIGWLGLRLRPDPESAQAWLGLSLPGPTLKNDGGRLVVSEVRRDTPAHRAGVNVDDEIVALDGYRVRPDQWQQRLEAFSPGDTTSLLVARRDRLITLGVTFASEPARIGRLEPDPGASPEARNRLVAWLGEDGSLRSP